MTYTFEYLFLPRLVASSNKADFSVESTILLDALDSLRLCFMEHYPQQAAHFDWKHFSIRKEMNTEREYWLLTFPEPVTVPEAKWGIIVHHEGRPYQYFTFEQGDRDAYFFCQCKAGRHINFGRHPKDLTESAFIELALEQSLADTSAPLRSLLEEGIEE